MFPKSALIFKVQDLAKLAALTEERLETYSFEPVQGCEVTSQGFSQVQDVYAYNYMGFTLLNLTIQKRSVPASAVKAGIKAVAKRMHEANGHAPGRKMLKEIKQQVLDELISRAIPTTKTHNIFIDTKTGFVTLDVTSSNVVSTLVSLLYQIGEIELEGVKFPGRAQLTMWLSQDDGDDLLPDLFTADDTVIFEHPGETGKTVKYERSNLSDEDVRANIHAGAQVLSLALTYADKISFVYKDGALGRIRALGVLAEKPKKDADAFQNAFYLAASEMTELTNYLIEVA